MEGGDMPILIISREHGIVENGNQGVWRWIKKKRRQDESQNKTDGQEQSHTEQDQVWVVTTAGPRSRGMLNNGSGTGGDRPRELPHAERRWANGLTFRRYENATVSGGQIVGSLYVAERTVQYFSRDSSRARFARVLPVPLRLLLHALLAGAGPGGGRDQNRSGTLLAQDSRPELAGERHAGHVDREKRSPWIKSRRQRHVSLAQNGLTFPRCLPTFLDLGGKGFNEQEGQNMRTSCKRRGTSTGNMAKEGPEL
ncbi:hypothetical protein PG996_008356 [Apiospora saccharicola]|uniref:Uncharacterized protein n=1 Tax=Apiospora saccharicola TaxID=335842 RepID=A0ABR1UXN7_9PEZI